jgi:hypothetical protein
MIFSRVRLIMDSFMTEGEVVGRLVVGLRSVGMLDDGEWEV